jgi:hypothetical protein
MGGFKCFWFINPKVLHTSADIHEDMPTNGLPGSKLLHIQPNAGNIQGIRWSRQLPSA